MIYNDPMLRRATPFTTVRVYACSGLAFTTPYAIQIDGNEYTPPKSSNTLSSATNKEEYFEVKATAGSNIFMPGTNTSGDGVSQECSVNGVSVFENNGSVKDFSWQIPDAVQLVYVTAYFSEKAKPRQISYVMSISYDTQGGASNEP